MLWRYFPANSKPNNDIMDIVELVTTKHGLIDSSKHNLSSNEVLEVLTGDFIKLGYDVEISKAKADKVRVPVLFGENGKEDLAFEADAYSEKTKIVIEVEAGRAIDNNQFLKDFFQACMMNDVDYLCIAVRKIYRRKADYYKVCSFFNAMYASNRLIVPLKGILIIGY